MVSLTARTKGLHARAHKHSPFSSLLLPAARNHQRLPAGLTARHPQLAATISSMLSPTPSSRPSAEALLDLFWAWPARDHSSSSGHTTWTTAPLPPGLRGVSVGDGRKPPAIVSSNSSTNGSEASAHSCSNCGTPIVIAYNHSPNHSHSHSHVRNTSVSSGTSSVASSVGLGAASASPTASASPLPPVVPCSPIHTRTVSTTAVVGTDASAGSGIRSQPGAQEPSIVSLEREVAQLKSLLQQRDRVVSQQVRTQPPSPPSPPSLPFSVCLPVYHQTLHCYCRLH